MGRVQKVDVSKSLLQRGSEAIIGVLKEERKVGFGKPLL
jgi:hypothetical protein